MKNACRWTALFLLLLTVCRPALADEPQSPDAALDAFFAAIDSGDADALRPVMAQESEGDKAVAEMVTVLLALHTEFHAAHAALAAKYPEQYLQEIDGELSKPGKPKLMGMHSPLDEFYTLRDAATRDTNVDEASGTATFSPEGRPDPICAVKTNTGWKLRMQGMAGALAERPEMGKQMAKKFANLTLFFEKLQELIATEPSFEALRKSAGDAYMDAKQSE